MFSPACYMHFILYRVCKRVLCRRSATKQELESLVRSLGHAYGVVKPGETFLHCMFELLSIPKKSRHLVRLNVSFRSDLYWWHTFLAPLNGISLSRRFSPVQFHFQFASDASGSIGCGAIWPPYWLQYKWIEGPCTLLSGSGSEITEGVAYCLGMCCLGSKMARCVCVSSL